MFPVRIITGFFDLLIFVSKIYKQNFKEHYDE